MPVLRRERPAISRERRRVAHMRNGWFEGLAVKMLGHHEAGEAFEHRHFDELAFACAFAMEERGQHRIDRVHARHLVGEERRASAACRDCRPLAATDPPHRRRLHEIVERLAACIRPIRAVTHAMNIDDTRD